MNLKNKDPYYIELYVDININIETFCLDDDEKKELKEHLEKWWRENQMGELLMEGRNKMFLMQLKRILED